jgi:hypothetical protein
MPLSEGWHDQYERMRRSKQRLTQAPDGPPREGRDLIYHFFQDAYHLKDWLKNDPALAMNDRERQALETHINVTDAFARCADICNGIKHLELDAGRERVPGKPARLTSQNVTIGGGGGTYSWDFTFDGDKYDVIELADEVVDEWTKWLKAQDLLD